MSTTIAPTSPLLRARRPARAEIREPRPAPTAVPPATALAAGARGGTVLFRVTFHSAMTDADLAHLARVFDLSTYMHPKLRPDPTSPGVARLDNFSGLFLERGPSEGEWILEGRTWGHPACEAVHEWHVLAAQGARQLDPRVALPGPLQDRPVETGRH